MSCAEPEAQVLFFQLLFQFSANVFIQVTLNSAEGFSSRMFGQELQLQPETIYLVATLLGSVCQKSEHLESRVVGLRGQQPVSSSLPFQWLGAKRLGSSLHKRPTKGYSRWA
jgi:hypothetical protein